MIGRKRKSTESHLCSHRLIFAWLPQSVPALVYRIDRCKEPLQRQSSVRQRDHDMYPTMPAFPQTVALTSGRCIKPLRVGNNALGGTESIL